MIVVSDTSVISSLLQIQHEHLIADFYRRALIPPAVENELRRAHASLPAFLEVQAVHDRTLVARLQMEIDPGEAEAIALAKETRAGLLLIDEKLGRQAALREHLRISGLIGLCVEARLTRRIVSLRAVVQRLENEAGFRVSRAVKEQAFILAGE